MKNDPYESSDAVFGVKESLIIELQEVTDQAMAEKYDVNLGTKLIKYDFVLVTEQVALQLRMDKAAEAMKAQGRDFEFIDGLPVPTLD